jgi:hypothetical protein
MGLGTAFEQKSQFLRAHKSSSHEQDVELVDFEKDGIKRIGHGEFL